MQPEEYKKMYNLQDHYWWYAGMRRKVTQEISTLYKKNRNNLFCLDIGCGAGGKLSCYKSLGQVIGLDTYRDVLNLSRSKGYFSLVEGLGDNLPFRDNVFDFIGYFDVLEFVKNDREAIQESYRILKEKGTLLVTTAAFNFLWSPHDLAVHTKRRYYLKNLILKFKQAGFTIEKSTYFNMLLFLPILALKKIKTILYQYGIKSITSDQMQLNFWLNNLLKRILYFECYLTRFFSLPFGVSIFLIARKDK